MSRRPRDNRRRTKLVAAAVIAALVSVVTVLSLRYEGVATADVTLHDGGVWVTKANDALVGRVNYAARATDGVLIGPSADLDVHQDGDLVFIRDLTTAQLYPVDTAAVAVATTGIQLPEDSAVQLASGVLNVTSPAGESWLVQAANAPSLPQTDAVAELDDGGLAVINRRMWWGLDRQGGTLYGGGIQEVLASAGDEQAWNNAVAAKELPRAIPADARVQISATASAPVILVQDEQAQAIWIAFGGDDPIDLGGYLAANDNVLLAAPSDTTGPIALAHQGGLLLISESGQIIRHTARQPGVPAQPVIVSGCVYGAWSNELGQIMRICADQVEESDLNGTTASPQLQFRVNRGQVVLNELNQGQTWQFDGHVVLMDQWQDVRPAEGSEDGHNESNPINLPDAVPIDRELANRDPIAANDEFGVRAGSTVQLPILTNDADPDGDVLTVKALTEVSEDFGILRAVNGGRAFEITVADDASGSQQFAYEVDDGRDGFDSAEVTLRVHPEDVNSGPEQQYPLDVTLSAGGQVRVYALGNVHDPDGDPVYLCSARSPSGLTVNADPSGYIEVAAPASASGRHEVILGFSDGRDLGCSETGVAKVDVLPAGGALPVPVNDHVSAYVEQPLVVTPLENDMSPSGGALTLSHVAEVPGLSIVPALARGEFEVTASEAGVYYLEYTVADERGGAALGLVRLDVVEPTSQPIKTSTDTAYLRALGNVMIAPAANDFDPAGEVLAITDVVAPAGISAAVLNHEFVVISAQGALDKPVQLTYTVANSTQSATGTINVIPVAQSAGLGPQPVHDVAVVRAGDYVSVPVMANDKHPGGQNLTLDPQLSDVEDLGGTMFVSNDLVRFLAPEQPGVAQATYTVIDELGNQASSLVTITVVEAAEENQPPKPVEVVGRVFAGDRHHIMIPVHGIDPNGDSVTLTGLASAPQLGIITEIGADYLIYEANAGASGIDEFNYTVQDRLGASAHARVRIAVLDRPDQNRPPYATADQVHVRPGRVVEFDPLANDSDPDGDALTFAEPALTTDLAAQVVGTRIRFESPQTPGTYLIQYHITDSYSAPVTGVVSVQVDEQAPLYPPVAVDDVVPVADVVGQSSITVPVLDNDYDPDGLPEDLQLSLPGADGASDVVVTGNQVTIPVGAQRRVVMYQVTDTDSLATYGFVDVPGYDDAPATLDPTAGSVQVRSGEVVDIALNDYVISARSPQVMLAEGAQVVATNSAGNEQAIGTDTLRYQSANGYHGAASITTTVVDGPGGSGPETLITIPILVLPAGDIPPVMRGTIIEVAEGEQADVDLAGLVTSPGAGNLNFEAGQATGLDLNLSGTTLQITATSAVAGTDVPVSITVTDSRNAQASAVITVRVTGSQAPLLVAVDDELGQLRAGVQTTHDVLANDFSPPGQSLSLVSVILLAGEAQLGISGNRVVITPAAGYAGVIEALYVVSDETGEAQRQGSARIRATVPGAPLQMAAPGIQSVGDQQVVLQLTAPTTRGSAINDFLITYNGGQHVCTSTLCTITGLTNGHSYSFVAIARTDAGDSAPSAASATVRVDRVPSAPARPTVVAGQASISASWPPVSGSVTGITYDVEISPSLRGVSQRKTSATSLDWGSLANGTAYSLRVRAVNGSGQAGPWSPWSQEVTPFGVPSTPRAPQVSLTQGTSQGSAAITWQAPASNGSPLTGYELRIWRGQELLPAQSFGAGTTSHTVATDHGVSYRFAVRATNAAGPSGWSEQSAPVLSANPLAAPTGVIGAGTGSSGKIRIRHNGATGGQGNITYQYRLHIGGTTYPLDTESTGLEIAVGTGQPNGTVMRASVRACSEGECGPWSELSPEFSPYGVLAAPGLSLTFNGNSVTFTWTSPPDAGAGVVNTRYQTQINGGGFGAWTTVSGSTGSVTIELEPGANLDFRVQAQDGHGNWGSQVTSNWQNPQQ